MDINFVDTVDNKDNNDISDIIENEEKKILLYDETQEAVAMVLRRIINFHKADWFKIDTFLHEIFKVLKILHKQQKNNILFSSQQLIIVLLRNILSSQTYDILYKQVMNGLIMMVKI